MKSKSSTTSFGAYPPVPIVHRGDFVQEKYPQEMYNNAWQLVGPTIKENLFKTRAANLHELYCIAFIEGMRMAIYQMKDWANDARRPELRETERSAPQEPPTPIQSLGTERRVVYLGYPSTGDL